MIVAAIIGPKTPEVAQGLLKAAASVGLPASSVTPVDDGYRVPSAVARAYEDGTPATEKPAAKKATKKATPAKKATPFARKRSEPSAESADTDSGTTPTDEQE